MSRSNPAEDFSQIKKQLAAAGPTDSGSGLLPQQRG